MDHSLAEIERFINTNLVVLVTFLTALAAAITAITSLVGVRNNRVLIEATLGPILTVVTKQTRCQRP